MAPKKIYLAMLLVVFVLAGWKVWDVIKIRQESVLGATTTKTLEERVASLESRVYTLEKNAGLISTKSTGKSKESYVSLTGGSVSSFDWVKIEGSDFTLDAALYGKNVEVSWQGWVEGSGSVRLYDVTNHRAVDLSDYTSASGGKKSFYSKVMSIWRGQNQYYIEGKTTNGEFALSSPRLRVVAK